MITTMQKSEIQVDTIHDSRYLKEELISAITTAFDVKKDEIINITALKKGLTNHSFLFSCRGKDYIMRIPGEGTDQLINREQELEVYNTINGKGICDNVVYFNAKNGYKITKYLKGARVCNPNSINDVRGCMGHLHRFHEMNLKVGHEFDLFSHIDFYESLKGGVPSRYKDYTQTKDNILSLKTYVDAHVEKKVLTHIDAVPDNFLFTGNGLGGEKIHLIDWEYAGMQDPHVDIAMFCIYSLYEKYQVDRLLRLYFIEGCPDETRLKIYCYIAICGLLWSNWCEYKHSLGVEFGEYSLCQYQYAIDYYRIVQDEWN